MNKLLLVSAVCVGLAVTAKSDATDAQVRKILYRATQYIDDPDGGPGDVGYAIRLTGCDTNRVVSLMKQLIVEGTEDVETTMFYISEIGKYGTSDDLPFLYSKVAVSNLCEISVMSILRIEGVSTGSVARICALLPKDNPSNRCVVASWVTLAAEVRDKCSDMGVRSLMVSNAVEYASRQNVFSDRIDQSIIRLDPNYRMSRRRLNALRSITNIGVHPSWTNYVANAINELVAYPEANLPE